MTPPITLQSVNDQEIDPTTVLYNSREHQFLVLWGYGGLHAAILSETGQIVSGFTPPQCGSALSAAFNPLNDQYALLCGSGSSQHTSLKVVRLHKDGTLAAPPHPFAFLDTPRGMAARLQYMVGSNRYVVAWDIPSLTGISLIQFQFLNGMGNKIGPRRTIARSCVGNGVFSLLQSGPADFAIFGCSSITTVLSNGTQISQLHSISNIAPDSDGGIQWNPQTGGFSLVYETGGPGSPFLARLDKDLTVTDSHIYIKCQTGSAGQHGNLVFNPVSKEYLSFWTEVNPGTGADITAQRIRLVPLSSGCH